MKFFFVGYMASGKSSLGKRVARQMNLPFIDMDKEIEEKLGLTVPEIFKLHGEHFFRQAESEFLIDLEKNDSNLIIATGGGVPCFHDNISVMNKQGLTIYLKRPAKELAHRISNSKKSRPLTDDLSEKELIDFIEKHLEEREHFYTQSELILDRSEQTTQGIIDALLPYTSDFLNKKKR